MKRLPQKIVDRWFNIVVVFKGVDGILEIIGAIFLLAVPSGFIHHFLIDLGKRDIVADHDILTQGITSLGHSFTYGIQIYTAVYLLLHGLIKVGLVAALLSRRYKLYPAAIIVLIAFMVYQIYRILTLHQYAFDGTLTLIDGLVVWLTIIEYRRHTQEGELPAA
jgi:uncharacterized membrane protein